MYSEVYLSAYSECTWDHLGRFLGTILSRKLRVSHRVQLWAFWELTWKLIVKHIGGIIKCYWEYLRVCSEVCLRASWELSSKHTVMTARSVLCTTIGSIPDSMPHSKLENVLRGVHESILIVHLGLSSEYPGEHMVKQVESLSSSAIGSVFESTLGSIQCGAFGSCIEYSMMYSIKWPQSHAYYSNLVNFQVHRITECHMSNTLWIIGPRTALLWATCCVSSIFLPGKNQELGFHLGITLQ